MIRHEKLVVMKMFLEYGRKKYCFSLTIAQQELPGLNDLQTNPYTAIWACFFTVPCCAHATHNDWRWKV